MMHTTCAALEEPAMVRRTVEPPILLDTLDTPTSDVVRLGEEIARLARSTHLMKQHMSAHAPSGVEWSAYGLLVHLVKSGPLRSADLASAACVDPSTISRQVAQLVKHGLVERQADPADGRASLLVATTAGREAFAALRRVREVTFARVVADWPERDVRRLADLLHAFNESFSTNRTEVLAIVSGALTEENA
jgi:DNA-binding MarR family transcriptional regulator